MQPVEAREPEASQPLLAYRLPGRRTYSKIVPASPDRFWMDVSTKGWANRCLPLRIANQSGWAILNDGEFEAKWSGKPALDSVTLSPKPGEITGNVSSMFGFGVITWTIPYIFRTPPGYNLLVRGPGNAAKDGIAALEAIVECDWLPYPFTMNWKFTRPAKTVRFEKDEPICFIMPIRRYDLESFAPEIRNIESEPALLRNYSTWHENRVAAQKALAEKAASTDKVVKGQGQYIRGENHSGERVEEHQTKLRVAKFVIKEEPAQGADEIVQPPAASRRSLLKRVFGG
jgi:hypothetical protein